MAKKKKNSNYVTDKTLAVKAEKEELEIKKQKAKTTKIVIISVVCALALIGIVVGFLFGVGAFEYQPEGTVDAQVTFDNGMSLHIQLYGKDAPQTTAHFTKLCKEGYFNGRSAHTFLEGLLYLGAENADGGDKGVNGEFSANGVANKIPMKKGTVCMARGEGKNSGHGQFFILSENDSSLMGEYAAFGRVTDLSNLEALIESIKVDANGKVIDAPKIVSISTHDSHH